MKKRIFAIALIVLITLSLFVPISVSAASYNGYDFADLPLLDGYSYYLIYEFRDVYYLYISEYELTHYNTGSWNDKPSYQLTASGTAKEYKYTDGAWVLHNEWGNVYLSIKTDEGQMLWSNYDIITTISGDTYGTILFKGSDVTLDQTYTIPAGLYIFNETPTLPTEDITQNFSTYFSVMINNGLENVVYNGLRMKFTPTTIEYNLDGTLTTVYKGPPLADVGWSNDGYRQVTFVEDVTVSEEFYNLFMENTTPPPEYKPPYVFSNDGITYDGSTIATYKDENTKRVDVENTYCAMFDNGYVFIVSSTEPFRIASSGHIRPNPSISFDMWYIENGVIYYMGTNTSFNPEKWVAGNHSILNWDDDFQYHGFDVGMVFPTTPQTQLPTVVGAEMLTGVMMEMIAVLPCLIALLMALIALRKALAILQQILHQA